MSKLTDYVVNKITLGEVCGVYEVVCPSMLRHHVESLTDTSLGLVAFSKLHLNPHDSEGLQEGFEDILKMLVSHGDVKIL